MKKNLFIAAVIFCSCQSVKNEQPKQPPAQTGVDSTQEKITIPDSIPILSQRDVAGLRTDLKKRLVMSVFERIDTVINNSLHVTNPNDSTLLYSAREFIKTDSKIKNYVLASEYEYIFPVMQYYVNFSITRFHNKQK